ncbi:MAG: zinc ribbon domain-containing protein [Desulfobacterales bacterium]|nr:zinc ribbon domain-containing protein [Desulfobacterales bacterium]MDD4392104.1 zinc ribbon domain-containing protein [Desulfobacterales bacterium]
MPIYEYHCDRCGKDFEFLVLGKDQAACPFCKNKTVSKLMSTCGFVNKGRGGETLSSSAASSSCRGCTAGSCRSCGH